MKNSTLAQLFFGYLAFIVVISLGCGDEKYYSSDDPIASDDNSKLTSEMKAILAVECSSCHSGEAFFTDYNAFKSQAYSRILSGNMPQGRKLSASDKAILLNR